MVSVPVATMIREQAVCFQLNDKFPELKSNITKIDLVTTLKDVWKFMFTETLGKKLNKKLEYNSSPFQIQVNVLYQDEDSECGAL